MKHNRDDPDAQLFRAAVADVKPLRQARPVPVRKKVPGRARFTRADTHAVLVESLEAPLEDPLAAGGDSLAFRRPGVQEQVLRKLRRGEYPVQAEIDLHGLTVAQAKVELRDFLLRVLARQIRCVRIVHGKGLRSGHRGPVLKNTVNSILRRTAVVLAFVSARAVDGGTGAVYVLLSR